MRRRKTAIFFIVLGISLSALAVALNVGWILLSFREAALLVFGIIFFALIITGLILNTIFLVREIRRNEQHDTFINAVTHELKTPIASIKLYLETLRERELDEVKRQEFYGIMLQDIDRLLKTVEQVLHAGRIREKKLRIDMSEVDLGGLIDETIGIVLTRYNLEKNVFRWNAPAEPVKVLGDRADLQTAFQNLLDNAVKYSEGKPAIAIRLKLTGRDKLDVIIRDHGIGIASADLKRIFRRFYRATTDAAVPKKGTGLGLAIVRSIIERHGGRVTAESKGVGKGSTFVVRLPVV